MTPFQLRPSVRSATRAIPAITGILAAIGMLPTTAFAGADIEESADVDAVPTVRIENTRGDVTVSAWDQSRVSVTGELDDVADGLTLTTSDDGREVLVRVNLPRTGVNWGDGSDLRIRVPTASRLFVDSVATDLRLDGIYGPVAVRSVSGDVRTEGLGGDIEIRTVSGDVDVDGGTGRARFVTTSGDLDIEVQASEVIVNAVSGTVELELAEFDRLTAGVVNAELEIAGRLRDNGRLTAESVNGDIELRLARPLNARVQARSGPGGDIDNGLTEQEPDREPARMHLDTIVGSGTASVDLTTVNGEIRLGN